MIKVIFKDGTTKRYQVGCRDLFCGNWDEVDYRWAFEPIAKIINVNVSTIQDWRVV